ncbi:MAG: hypothetical protein ACRDL8_04345, partial [Solirubrobacteraceae bacterium]
VYDDAHGARPHSRGSTGGRLVFAAGAATAVCAAVLASVFSFGGGSGDGVGLPLAVSPAQAAELNRIAQRAAQDSGS